MAIKTTYEQIEEVQAAITKTLEAISVSQGDKSILRSKLRDLTEREEWLLARYKREQNTGGPSFNIGVRKRF